MPADFTMTAYRLLIQSLQEQGYTFQTYAEFLRNPGTRVVVLRHDVDALKGHSMRFAELQHTLGIRGTYYFRIVRGSWDESIIRRISALGHEVGLHYEDMAIVGREGATHQDALLANAYIHFCHHLKRLRELVPVETICNHGSPMSKFDNKTLWKHYDYRALGIVGEPYFDTDFTRVGYFTESGRCWNGGKYIIRDKPVGEGALQFPEIRTTYDLATAIRSGSLPDQLLLTFHPQRWNVSAAMWLWELIAQNVKNVIKHMISKRKTREPRLFI
jgi:hypothetical protein